MKSLAIKTLTSAAILCVIAGGAFAQSPNCKTQAADKKLAGAALASFTKKCEADAKSAATKTCDAQAAEKKLAGAAKTSFTTKCVKDALGS